MDAATPTSITHVAKRGLVESPVRELLDHIAVELAAEYVRLMEAAADAEAPSSPPLHAAN